MSPLVLDLSHYEFPCDFAAIKQAGVLGVIWKATQGDSYVDQTYQNAKRGAKGQGLLWGSYHFLESSDGEYQAQNYLQAARIEPDELFCADWEDAGPAAGVNTLKTFVTTVEQALNRPHQCVIYSGNVAKEKISGVDTFFGSRRLWLAQYTSGTPDVQESWKERGWWLWQYTDSGEAAGVSDACDCNEFNGPEDELVEEWASGRVGPPAPTPVRKDLVVKVSYPKGVKVVLEEI